MVPALEDLLCLKIFNRNIVLFLWQFTHWICTLLLADFDLLVLRLLGIIPMNLQPQNILHSPLMSILHIIIIAVVAFDAIVIQQQIPGPLHLFRMLTSIIINIGTSVVLITLLNNILFLLLKLIQKCAYTEGLLERQLIIKQLGQLHFDFLEVPPILRYAVLNEHENEIVVSEAHGQMVLAEVIGYQRFHALLQVKEEHLLR